MELEPLYIGSLASTVEGASHISPPSTELLTPLSEIFLRLQYAHAKMDHVSPFDTWLHTSAFWSQYLYRMRIAPSFNHKEFIFILIERFSISS